MIKINHMKIILQKTQFTESIPSQQFHPFERIRMRFQFRSERDWDWTLNGNLDYVQGNDAEGNIR